MINNYITIINNYVIIINYIIVNYNIINYVSFVNARRPASTHSCSNTVFNEFLNRAECWLLISEESI